MCQSIPMEISSKWVREMPDWMEMQLPPPKVYVGGLANCLPIEKVCVIYLNRLYIENIKKNVATDQLNVLCQHKRFDNLKIGIKLAKNAFSAKLIDVLNKFF